jgi:hypothetical protein
LLSALQPLPLPTTDEKNINSQRIAERTGSNPNRIGRPSDASSRSGSSHSLPHANNPSSGLTQQPPGTPDRHSSQQLGGAQTTHSGSNTPLSAHHDRMGSDPKRSSNSLSQRLVNRALARQAGKDPDTPENPPIGGQDHVSSRSSLAVHSIPCVLQQYCSLVVCVFIPWIKLIAV